MCRQYDAPPFPLCCPTIRAAASASGSASVHLFCHCRCHCRCRCHCLCLCFYCSVWLSYQRPWASPEQTNHRSVLWVAHKAIKQGKSRRRKGVDVLETGWHATDACARDFHMTRVTTLPTAAGHGTQIKGGCKGARDWERYGEGGKCQWANRKYKSRALKATPKNRANPRKPRTENRRYQRTKRR